jgi:type I restriction enzyme S subunit
MAWLGEIPDHWAVGNLRRFAAMRTGHTPSRQEASYWEDCAIPWFTLADVWQLRDGSRKYLGETSEMISQSGLANSAAELLPVGTVVLSRTASVGYSGIMPRPMATSQDFWNWVCGPRLSPEYLLQVFRAMKPEFARLTMGSTHKTIYQSDAAGIAICIPPMEEQRAIVDFIDVATAKVCALIAKKEALVERLREKRRALISRVVTRGIPPGAARAAGIISEPMLKPSGVPWLGDVPEHWDVLPAKRTWSEVAYGVSDSLSGEGAVRVLTMGDVREGTVRIPDRGALDDVPAELLLRAGDLLYNRTNSLANVGKVGLYDGRSSEPLSFASYLVRLRVNRRALPAFLNYLLNTPSLLAYARGLALPSINQANLNPTRYGQIPIPVPPVPEQRALVEYLDRETAKLDGLIAKIETAIACLREHRSALITAAVTGKIEVRNAGAKSELFEAVA